MITPVCHDKESMMALSKHLCLSPTDITRKLLINYDEAYIMADRL